MILKDKKLVSVLVLSFVLRLINFNQSLWLDEAINVLAAKNLGFWHFVTGYPIGDFHPPFYFVVLWIWGYLFGFSEISVRFPSVIFGVLTVWIIYLIGNELFSKKTALLGALLLCLNPLHIYYSQEARMYSLAAFSVTISFYFLIRVLKRKNLQQVLLYALSLALVLYSDYVAYFAIASQFIYLLWVDRKKLVMFLQSFSVAFVIFSPWLLVFPNQLANGRETAQNVPGWAKVVGGSNFKNLVLVFLKSIIGRITLVDKKIYAVVAGFLFLTYGSVVLLNLKKLNDSKKLLFCWVFVPTLTTFLFSYFIPVLSYFRLLYIVPAFCLLLASGLDILSFKKQRVVITFLVLVSLICAFFYFSNSRFQREDWKGLSNYLTGKADVSSLAIFEDSGLPAPYIYYDQKKMEVLGGLSHFPASVPGDVNNLNENLIGKERVYLVDYLVQIADPNREIDRQLTALGWRVDHIENFYGVGFVYEYSR